MALYWLEAVKRITNKYNLLSPLPATEAGMSSFKEAEILFKDGVLVEGKIYEKLVITIFKQTLLRQIRKT